MNYFAPFLLASLAEHMFRCTLKPRPASVDIGGGLRAQ
jgi:hypothetical protein